MSKHKTEREKIQELEVMIHDIQKNELMTVKYITDKMKEVATNLDKLDAELIDAQDELKKCPVKEIRRWEAIVRCIHNRKEVLASYKQVLHESRLSLRLLMMKENQLTFRKTKLEAQWKSE